MKGIVDKNLTKSNILLVILFSGAITVAILSTTPSVYSLPNLDSVVLSPQTPDEIKPGGSATFYVVVIRGEMPDAFQATLSIAGELPSGVSASFDPDTVSFEQDGILPQFSILTLTSSDTTPVVNGTFIVQATNSDLDIATGLFRLIITDNHAIQEHKKSRNEIYETPTTAEPPVSEPLIQLEPVPNTILSNLRARSISQSIIDLSWSPPSNGTKISSYIIERKSPDQTDYVKIAEVSPEFLTFSDAKLLGDTTYSYRVSVVDSEGIKSFSSDTDATTLPYVNTKNSITDRIPPAINSIKFFTMANDIKTAGFGGRLAANSNDIPLQIMQTGVQNQLEIRVSDNSGIAAIKHVGLIMKANDDMKKTDTFFVYTEGQGLQVYDPLGLFNGTHVYRTFTNTEMVLTILFTPQKPISITDPIISSWDANLNTRNTILLGTFEIQGEQVGSIQADVLPPVIPYYKNPEWDKVVIDSHGNMIAYDAFGNLYTKPVHVMDEIVHYGDYVGRSERHDDGFYNSVSAEEVKAKDIADILMKNPIYSEEQKSFKVDKAFPYPSNIGHGDRSDIKSLEKVLEKENTRAQKHK